MLPYFVRQVPTSIVRTEKDKIICPGLEAVVPPVMQLYFDFGDLANSLLYLGWGQAEVIRLLALKFYLVFVFFNSKLLKLFYRECNTFTIFFRYRTGQRVTV